MGTQTVCSSNPHNLFKQSLSKRCSAQEVTCYRCHSDARYVGKVEAASLQLTFLLKQSANKAHTHTLGFEVFAGVQTVQECQLHPLLRFCFSILHHCRTMKGGTFAKDDRGAMLPPCSAACNWIVHDRKRCVATYRRGTKMFKMKVNCFGRCCRLF